MKIYLSGFLFLAMGICVCFGGEKEIYRDENVVATEKTWPFYPILGLHTGSTICLRVSGTRYCGVRGSKPYYLAIPQIHSIIFVAEGDSSKVTFYIVNLETKKCTAIDGGTTGFGGGIGASVPQTDADYVEKADAKTMVLVTHGSDTKVLITINLVAAVKEREEFFRYDSKGQVIEHKVYVHGKLEE